MARWLGGRALAAGPPGAGPEPASRRRTLPSRDAGLDTHEAAAGLAPPAARMALGSRPAASAFHTCPAASPHGSYLCCATQDGPRATERLQDLGGSQERGAFVLTVASA